MSPGRALSIYLIVWVITFFALLPMQVRSVDEDGRAPVPGQMAGAPVDARLLWKAKWTTIVATGLFALIYLNAARGWITWANLQFLPAAAH